MEQQEAAHEYWMWMQQQQRKHILKTRMTMAMMKPYNNNEESWEEQAFAEDAAGPLGGCIWPPRSYSCSFCRREFRSAQALGGHMNVHRRDRARLKQSLSSLSPPNCNPTFQASSDLSPPSSRVSANTTNNNNMSFVVSPHSSTCSYTSIVEGNNQKEECVVVVDTDLCVGMGWSHRNCKPTGSDGDNEVISSCSSSKRHKTSNSIEELDLELRLGDPSTTTTTTTTKCPIHYL